jgi:hypothetical protein
VKSSIERGRLMWMNNEATRPVAGDRGTAAGALKGGKGGKKGGKFGDEEKTNEIRQKEWEAHSEKTISRLSRWERRPDRSV